MGERVTTVRRGASPIGVYWEVTLCLSNLSVSSHGRTGVTLRNRSLYLSHLWRTKGELRLSPRGFSKTEPRASSPGTDDDVHMLGTGRVVWWVYLGWYRVVCTMVGR